MSEFWGLPELLRHVGENVEPWPLSLWTSSGILLTAFQLDQSDLLNLCCVSTDFRNKFLSSLYSEVTIDLHKFGYKGKCRFWSLLSMFRNHSRHVRSVVINNRRHLADDREYLNCAAYCALVALMNVLPEFENLRAFVCV